MNTYKRGFESLEEAMEFAMAVEGKIERPFPNETESWYTVTYEGRTFMLYYNHGETYIVYAENLDEAVKAFQQEHPDAQLEGWDVKIKDGD